MRLIDADDLKKDLLYVYTHLSERYKISPALSLINDAPTIDAVPIVRCKDCKFSEYWYRDRRRCFLWVEDGISVFDDGFCNYAERKEDDTT